MAPFTPIIDQLPSSVPFVGPEALTRKTGYAIKARIGANESVFGPSPRVIEAIQAASADCWHYGDPENFELKQAIAAHLGVPPENIAIGEGIDGLFGYAVRLFVDEGKAVATSFGAYPTFNFHVAACGGRLLTTPYVDDREDPQSLIALARRENASVIYFANPDNPMGTHWPAAAINKLIAAVPANAILMLDEAYGEFAPPGTLPPLDVGNPNVLRFRTFSKAYGLAGLRIGYAIGHADVVKAFDKIRNHFGMTVVSQQAAIAAIQDQDWLAHVLGEVAAARELISDIARANRLQPIPSATNFVSIDCGRDGAYARAIVDGLLQHGVFIRMPGVAPLNRCIRVSCGMQKDLKLFAEALPQVLQAIS